MNFSELVAKTCEEVDRPDFTFQSLGGSGQAVNAVLASILTLHQREFYWRDVKQFQAVFDEAAYILNVDISTLPRFRKMRYVRKWDTAYQQAQINPAVAPPTDSNMADALGFLTEIDPSVIFDRYGYEHTNVWYAAGDSLLIKSNTMLSRALIGYFAGPELIPGSDNLYSASNSWIMSQYPWAIIYHAASKLFVQIGQQETSRKYDRPPSGRGDSGGLVQEQLAIIDANNITAGY